MLKVWLCLGVTLVVLAPLLTCLSIFYRKHIGARMDERGVHPRSPAVPVYYLDELLNNLAFLLTHLTNQGSII